MCLRFLEKNIFLLLYAELYSTMSYLRMQNVLIYKPVTQSLESEHNWIILAYQMYCFLFLLLLLLFLHSRIRLYHLLRLLVSNQCLSGRPTSVFPSNTYATDYLGGLFRFILPIVWLTH